MTRGEDVGRLSCGRLRMCVMRSFCWHHVYLVCDGRRGGLKPLSQDWKPTFSSLSSAPREAPFIFCLLLLDFHFQAPRKLFSPQGGGHNAKRSVSGKGDRFSNYTLNVTARTLAIIKRVPLDSYPEGNVRARDAKWRPQLESLVTLGEIKQSKRNDSTNPWPEENIQRLVLAFQRSIK